MTPTDDRTFVAACLAGSAQLDDVDCWVDRWHDAPANSWPGTVALDEHLGFTAEEGDLWAETPQCLPHIVSARTHNTCLTRQALRAVYGQQYAGLTTPEAIDAHNWLSRNPAPA